MTDWDPSLAVVEEMHDNNVHAWDNLLHTLLEDELKTIEANESERTVTVTFTNGAKFTVSNINTRIKTSSLAAALEQIFVKLMAFPMAMEVKEE